MAKKVNNDFMGKVKGFLKPNKKKVTIFVVLVGIVMLINFYEIGLACFPRPCEDGSMPKIERPYSRCPLCNEPTLIEDIIKYPAYFIIRPTSILFYALAGRPQYYLFFILDLFVIYLGVCTYVKIREKR